MSGEGAFAGLDLETREQDGYAIVEVRGEVDVYSHARLRQYLEALYARGARSLVIDAAGIEFIDSSGLGVLVGAYKRSNRRGGFLLVAAPCPRVARMLQITGLERVFGRVESVQAAVDRLQAAARETV